MTIIGKSHYETYIAEKIGIPYLRAGTWEVESTYIEVTRLWYARVSFGTKNFVVSVVESKEWLKSLIGIIENNEIIYSVVQNIESDYVEPYLRNLDVYSDNEPSRVDGLIYHYRLITRTKKSSGIFFVNDPLLSSKQGELFATLIKLAQTTASKSKDKKLQDYLNQIPDLSNEDFF